MTIVLDHVHLIVTQPLAAAQWFVEMLEGERVGEATVLGAPQVYIRFGEGLVIIRGKRPDEPVHARAGAAFGPDHFGFRIAAGFDDYCERLRTRGVRFLREPVAINDATRVAFVEGPDAMPIELVQRSEWPDLRALGLEAGRRVTPPPTGQVSHGTD